MINPHLILHRVREPPSKIPTSCKIQPNCGIITVFLNQYNNIYTYLVGFNMKNIIFIFLSAFLSLSLISCGGSDDSTSSGSSGTTSSSQTFVDANHCRLTKNSSSRNSSLIVNERESDSINEKIQEVQKEKEVISMSTNLPFPNTRRTTISI